MQTSYLRNPSGGYFSESLPPLQFEYADAEIDETVRDVDSDSLQNEPYGLDRCRRRDRQERPAPLSSIHVQAKNLVGDCVADNEEVCRIPDRAFRKTKDGCDCR